MLSYELTPDEQALIDAHLPFYCALVEGTHRPTTPAQQRFIDVAHGYALPESTHEIVYARYRHVQSLHDLDTRIVAETHYGLTLPDDVPPDVAADVDTETDLYRPAQVT